MFSLALLLGIIEGLTEFLPVSSTGHLIIFSDLLGFEGPNSKTFEIVIQLGAILAICWLYRAKLWSTARGMLQQNTSDVHFAANILVAFLPAMLLGGLLHGFIKTVLFNPTIVAAALLGGGVAILLAERYKPAPSYHALGTLSLPVCLKIGVCQCLALIPGTSRSGATIIGALLLGVDRKTAAEFSFFLAIPTMFAATVYDLYKSRHELSFDGWQLVAIGFVSAFVAAMLVVKVLMRYIERHGFTPFAWYRIALGAGMLLLLLY